MTDQRPAADEAFIRNATSSFLRIGGLLLILFYCLRIVAPFTDVTLWAIIIAVALYPLHLKLAALLGGRPKCSAMLMVAMGLTMLLLPVSIAAESGIESARALGAQLRSGQVSVPPPGEQVREWPVIGSKAFAIWSAAAEDLQATMNDFRPQLIASGEWMIRSVGHAGRGVLQFVVSIILAGFFLIRAESCYAAARRFMKSLAGEGGAALTDLSIATIRSVAKGVIGVAVLQTLLAGVGLVAMDVPATGLILAVVLAVAIMQIPTMIVLGPLVLWVYSTADAGPATLFAAYMLLVGLSDNVLKPLLLGRGVKIPTLVILVGAIGGAIAAGVIGLFLGAVVLAVFYELLAAWMNPEADTLPAQDEAG